MPYELQNTRYLYLLHMNNFKLIQQSWRNYNLFAQKQNLFTSAKDKNDI